jgi:hypothetical protein
MNGFIGKVENTVNVVDVVVLLLRQWRLTVALVFEIVPGQDASS